MLTSQQKTVIVIGLVLALALYYHYFYSKSSSSATPAYGMTTGGTMALTPGCDNSLRTIAQEYDVIAQLDANATQADYDNHAVSASKQTVAGSMAQTDSVFALNKAYRDKWGLSEDFEYHNKYKTYYGCGLETVPKASCFDSGAMLYGELKSAVMNAQ